VFLANSIPSFIPRRTFCFEKGAAKHAGGDGFADVWKRGFFGFEYKGKHKDLAAAYDPLLRYRNALENPPLLVVCDLDRIIGHTHFTGTVSATHEIPLESLGEVRNVGILRAVFHNPETLHPVRTSVAVTEDAARRFAEIAAAMRQRGLDPASVAHFLDRIVFCLFAEDTRLLPDRVLSRIVKSSRSDPARFGKILGQLFETMATVMMTVLRREWNECTSVIHNLLTTGHKTPACADAAGRPSAAAAPAKPLNAAALKKVLGEAGSILHRFLDRLQRVRILDPACGSGNFLDVALLRLKDLEKEAILYGNDNGLGSFLPMVGPWQLYGMEINSYAHDLAQMTVWIGWLQWIRANGFGFPADPILRSLSENIRRMDAIVSDDGEPEWPTVNFIVGNPPFLGGKMLRREMGDEYVDRIFANWRGRVPPEAERSHRLDGKATETINSNLSSAAADTTARHTGTTGGVTRRAALPCDRRSCLSVAIWQLAWLPSIVYSFGFRRLLSRLTLLLYSPAPTNISSACCTPAFMKFGPWHKARSCGRKKAAFAIHRPPALNPLWIRLVGRRRGSSVKSSLQPVDSGLVFRPPI